MPTNKRMINREISVAESDDMAYAQSIIQPPLLSPLLLFFAVIMVSCSTKVNEGLLTGTIPGKIHIEVSDETKSERREALMSIKAGVKLSVLEKDKDNYSFILEYKKAESEKTISYIFPAKRVEAKGETYLEGVWGGILSGFSRDDIKPRVIIYLIHQGEPRKIDPVEFTISPEVPLP